jgi:hypothetical protein
MVIQAIATMRIHGLAGTVAIKLKPKYDDAKSVDGHKKLGSISKGRLTVRPYMLSYSLLKRGLYYEQTHI